MDGKFITLTPETLPTEHICCAFSDKKCTEGTRLKKEWLAGRFQKGFVFRRLDERAKVFIEYVPAEQAWMPVEAPGYLAVHCMWVSGSYQKKGYAKELLARAVEDAVDDGRHGIVAVAGIRKFHFMTDPKWLIKQGFTLSDKTPDGFGLYVLKLRPDAPDPKFAESALRETAEAGQGVTAYYSDRCPFTQFHVNGSLAESCAKRGIACKVIKLDTLEKARTSPTPATVFSLYYNGKFVTTDISACMDSRFDKFIRK